jgi:hypothetical protein
VDKLTGAVRGLATQMRRLPVAVSAPPPQTEPADCAPDCGGTDPHGDPPDHGLEIVGGVLAVGLTAVGVAMTVGAAYFVYVFVGGK